MITSWAITTCGNCFKSTPVAIMFVTTRRGVLRFYRFFLAESKFVHDLNFDFFLFEHLPPFLIVDFSFRTLDFNSSVCNVY